MALKNDLLDEQEGEISLTFAAVRWCEVVLPLLGFLGTVIGIGDAMVGVSAGVGALFRGLPLESAVGDLNQGFRGMSVAFDTTFLGLAGLLLIGAGHQVVKKGLAARLSVVRQQTNEKVSRWIGGHMLVGVIQGVEKQMLNSDLRLRALESAVRESDFKAREFRQHSRGMVEAVIREDPSIPIDP